jgi:hypothetical protein
LEQESRTIVMAGLVPAIHVFGPRRKKDVDARDKPGHDGRKITHRPGMTAIASSAPPGTSHWRAQ